MKVFLILFSIFAFASEDIEMQKINFLLGEVEKSKATFIRNGDEHSAKDARAHLQYKLDFATKSFFFFGKRKDVTVENFINKIASGSSTTGKDYYIVDKGVKFKTKDWLNKKLEEFSPQKSHP